MNPKFPVQICNTTYEYMLFNKMTNHMLHLCAIHIITGYHKHHVR